MAAALEETGIPASRLRLELTETKLGTDPRVREQLRALRRLGCQLVVDDFGTGYSSLSRLIDLPVDEVKIDKWFVAGVGHDPRRSAVVSATLLLAHTLRQHVIAEVAETAEQLTWLIDAGCTAMQGYYVAAPMPPEQLPPELLPLRLPT